MTSVDTDPDLYTVNVTASGDGTFGTDNWHVLEITVTDLLPP